MNIALTPTGIIHQNQISFLLAIYMLESRDSYYIHLYYNIKQQNPLVQLMKAALHLVCLLLFIG